MASPMMASQNSTGKSSFFLEPGQGLAVSVLGSDYIFKVRAGTTGNGLCQFEGIIAPGMGSPPHKVQQEDKTFFVLEGTFDFLVGEQHVTLVEGGFVAVPRGLAHGFINVGSTRGRLLVTLTPAGHHEEMFMELAQLSDTPPDLFKIKEIASRYQVELL